MGLGRRTGNETDWLKMASAVNTLGGALERGGKYQDYRRQREKEEAVGQAQEKAQTAIQLGVSPEDARTQVLEQTRYQEPGFVGRLMGEEGTYQRSFTPEVAEAGFQKALASKRSSIDQEVELSKSNIEKLTQQYEQQFAGMSPDEMQTLDTTQMENPAAATRAKGRYFVEHGKTDQARGQAAENLRKTRETMYNKFSSAVRTADNLLKDPTTTNRKKGVELMVDATNNMNNTAYRAEEVTVNGKPMIQTFMIYDGERRDGDQYTPEDYSKVLKGITQQTYYQAFDRDKQLSLELNKKSLENPDWMVNDAGEMVQVQTFRNPLTSDHQYMIYSKEGGMYPVQDRQELLKQGFRNYQPTKKAKTGATSKALTNNMKVLDKAIELVKQSGKYTTDIDGNITETATGKPAGEALTMEAIQLMPRLGKALSDGEIQELLEYIQNPEVGGEDGIYGELGIFDAPAQAVQTNTRVTPLTNPSLQVSPFKR